MSTADVDLSPIPKESVLSPGHFHGQSGPLSSESIMIYLTVSGSVIPMRVLESDSISSVKLRIQSCKGFVVKKQKLVFGGRELARNDSLVRDYGVTDGNVLHLVLRLSDLRVITVKTACGKDLEFHVERCRSIAYIKQQIAKKGKDFVDLKDQELICNGEELEDQWLIDDISKNSDAVIHLLVRKSAKVRAKPVEKEFELSVVASELNEGREFDEEEVDGGNQWSNGSKDLRVVTKKPVGRDFNLQPVIVNPKIKLSSVISDLVSSTFDGLESGNQPVRSSEGSGGAYFMPDSSGHKFVSVFKPIDEEPMAVNNPRGLPISSDGEGLKRGTRVGEGAFREVAAYVLDHPRSGPRSLLGEERGFAGVPPTVMVRCLQGEFNHPDGYQFSSKNVKIGSLQMFMKNIGSCEDMGPRAFPVEEVHKISVLDIRLANADRHAGNILVGKEGDRTVLIPIDHGYCLPENFEDCTFDWLYWPQAHEPYTPETIEYIRSLDAEQDIALLKFYGWNISHECARIFRISTMLLKKGAERGLTPFAIGSIMCRETLKKESVIEKIIHEAMDALLPGMSESVFLESVSQIMDRYLELLTI
ncbi:phosphatidylinositol 4-kinase gamma 4-like [Telopea speciosissima]|uniref:phosphatidylinositol 4-kinase gamma 4-like n=1 Tax=Telopea speciosissima TaxID=54955 RepID=UPI001CC66A70|nr:phosphatidylinositol 4-kinase gamma 4-like [Telopea speciosissima]